MRITKEEFVTGLMKMFGAVMVGFLIGYAYGVRREKQVLGNTKTETTQDAKNT